MAQESNTDCKNNADVIEQLRNELQETFAETNKDAKEFRQLEQQLQDDFIKRLKLGEQITNPKTRKIFTQLCHLHKWLMYNNIHMYGADESNKIWWCELADIPFIEDLKKGGEESPELKELKNFVKEMQIEWLYDFFTEFMSGNDARRKYQKLPDVHK